MQSVEVSAVLLEHTPEPEQLCEIAARRCTSNKISPELIDKLSALKTCIERGHESIFEHVTFTFHVQGVSRSLLAQITRHRLASFSVMSQRYNDEFNFNYVIPDRIKKLGDWAIRHFARDMEYIQKMYDFWHGILLEEGYTEQEANEDARFVLPNAAETKFIVTMNARELLHVFSLRCCNRAQWEIRKLAKSMLRQCKAVAPTIFANAGPPCVRGKCPEGKNGCGKPWRLDDEDL